MSRKRIFVVDDDHDILELVATYLEQEGYEVITATGGRHIVSYVQEIQPDLIILDIMLPDMDGIEICVELRKFTHVPIFFLSGKTAEIDKIVGLTIGADDYISKPFSPRELVARVKAHLRRYTRVPKTVLHFPGLEIDLANRHVYANNKMVPLSNKEFSLLAQLAQHPKRVFQVEELFELIWGEQSYGDARTVMVHISNLRKKSSRIRPIPSTLLPFAGTATNSMTGRLPNQPAPPPVPHPTRRNGLYDVSHWKNKRPNSRSPIPVKPIHDVNKKKRTSNKARPHLHPVIGTCFMKNDVQPCCRLLSGARYQTDVQAAHKWNTTSGEYARC